MTSDDGVTRYLAGDDVLPSDLSEAERGELDSLRALFGEPSTWVEPPAGLGDSVVAAIAAERRAVPAVLSPPASRPSTAARGATRRRSVLTFLAGAAAAAAVVGGLVVVRNGAADAGTQVALAGTDLAPGVQGVARVTEHESGVRIELNATGLPRRDGRLFYQAWLKGDAGLVPIGTFHTGDHVVLWAGVAVREFPVITVTQEEVGNQESSGRRVLVGNVSG